MNPSGVNIKPEPLPRRSCGVRGMFGLRLLTPSSTSIYTTDGLTFSAAVITAREYASITSSSVRGVADLIAPTGSPLLQSIQFPFSSDTLVRIVSGTSIPEHSKNKLLQHGKRNFNDVVQQPSITCGFCQHQ